MVKLRTIHVFNLYVHNQRAIIMLVSSLVNIISEQAIDFKVRLEPQE